MLNILTVDDDEITQFHLNQLLLPLGRNRMAYSGEDAIARVEESIASGDGFDVILMDVIMPGIDGLKTVSEIVRLFNEKRIPLERRPKIVMLSSVEERETQIDALYACGADHYIMKPVDEEVLLGALKELGVIPPGQTGLRPR
ncbi:MAG: response regulator [Thermodesulfobacteriota bacterium]